MSSDIGYISSASGLTNRLAIGAISAVMIASICALHYDVSAQDTAGNITLPTVDMPSVSEAPMTLPPAPMAAAPSAAPDTMLEALPIPDVSSIAEQAGSADVQPEVIPQVADQLAQPVVPNVEDTSAIALPDVSQALPSQNAQAVPSPTFPAAQEMTPPPVNNPMAANNPASQAPTEQAKQEPTQTASLTTDAKSPIEQLVKEGGLSIGTFGVSLMYSVEDINNLKQVLEVYEAVRSQPVQEGTAQTKGDADLLAELLRASQGQTEEVIPELPTELPSFYVGSIIYRSAADWSVWINGKLYNPKKNEDKGARVRIESVGRDRLTIAWMPENPVQAQKRYEQAKQAVEEMKQPQKESNDKDKAKADDQAQGGQGAPKEEENIAEKIAADPSPIKRQRTHREARSGEISHDEESGEYRIVLRANQTFIGNSMQIMEGKFATSVAADTAKSGAGTPAAAAPGGGQMPGGVPTVTPPTGLPGTTTDERALSNQMLNNLKQIGNITQGNISGVISNMSGAPQ